MITSNLRGHEIEYVNGEWIYSDTKEPTATTYSTRPCGYCGKHNTPKGHDGCLGTLPDVMNACCGHGNVNETYLQFWNGEIVRGIKAKMAIGELKE